MSPFNAWVLSKSLETLDVRMERHATNALHIAKALEHHPKISFLKYPFLPSHPQYEIAKKQMKNGGGIVCFDLTGGLESGRKFLNNLKMLSLTANLGDTRSIASHPASTTHAKLTEEERLATRYNARAYTYFCWAWNTWMIFWMIFCRLWMVVESPPAPRRGFLYPANSDRFSEWVK